ncbi:hypothetical protein ACT4S2_16770 [Kocuria turfanensis]|uniref:hypothetical protein n=1 Tax=Kocuria turfanensis TaxID=388357 RepID=UPI004035CC2D
MDARDTGGTAVGRAFRAPVGSSVSASVGTAVVDARHAGRAPVGGTLGTAVGRAFLLVRILL